MSSNKISFRKWNYFGVKEFFSEILVSKMGVKINFWMKTKKYSGLKPRIHENCFLSPLISRVQSDSVGINSLKLLTYLNHILCKIGPTSLFYEFKGLYIENSKITIQIIKKITFSGQEIWCYLTWTSWIMCLESFFDQKFEIGHK